MEEMIEKQITVLMTKSQLEEFERVAKGYKYFVVGGYSKESNLGSMVRSESLSFEITSTKITEICNT